MKKQFMEEPVLLINQNHSKLSLTHQRWQLAWYLLNWIQMVTDTPLLSC
jgi:hypothetical protein